MGNFSAAILSPSRIAFAGYLLLIYLGKLETTKFEFVLVSLLYLALDIFHNDYFRILLNHWAERRKTSKSESK